MEIKPKIKNVADIKEAIALLEARKTEETRLLREQFCNTVDSLRPVNLIKRAFHDVTSSPELKGDLINSGIGLVGGILSKKLLVGGSGGFLRKMLGTVIQLGVTNLISNNSDPITSFIKNLGKKRKPKEEAHEEERDII